MLSFAGGGNGNTVRALLEREQLPCRWIETAAETRICQTLLSDDHNGCTELVEENPPLAAAEWKAFVKTFAQLESGFDRIVFSGNLPNHAPQDIYAELIAQTDGRKVLMDTSGAPLLAALERRPAMVKLNAEEIGITVRDSADTIDQARELIAQGAGSVGITDGKNSARLITPNHVLTFSIPEIKAVNPIGSGDAVSAGTSFALAKGSPLPEAFAFGLACGTSNAMNLAPGHIELDQIATLVSRIKIS
jgi:tagatose 6-phosphate kinase